MPDADSTDRATVALVNAKVETVKVLAEGIRDQLAHVATLPERVAQHTEQLGDHERRLDEIERGEGEDDERAISLRDRVLLLVAGGVLSLVLSTVVSLLVHNLT